MEEQTQQPPTPQPPQQQISIEERKRLQLPLLQTVEELVEELRRSLIIVEEFRTDSQQLLFDKLNRMIYLYEKIESNRSLFDDVEIPLEIFRVIDQSKNPDLFVKETLQNCLTANEKTKGKIESIKIFKNELESHISESFANEYAEYKIATQKIKKEDSTDVDVEIKEEKIE